MEMVHLCHRDVRQLNLEHPRQEDAHLADALQNLDVQIRDEHQTLVDALLDEADVVQVDAELRHRQRMDCCQRVVDVALQMVLRMDCCLQQVASLALEQMELLESRMQMELELLEWLVQLVRLAQLRPLLAH